MPYFSLKGVVMDHFKIEDIRPQPRGIVQSVSPLAPHATSRLSCCVRHLPQAISRTCSRLYDFLSCLQEAIESHANVQRDAANLASANCTIGIVCWANPVQVCYH